MRHKNYKNGFTLIEVLIAVIFVGLAIAALLAGNGALTKANNTANEMSTAEFLTEQIKELLLLQPFNALLSYDDANYNPPKDANGNVLNNFAAYSQKIIIENVQNNDFTKVVADNSSNFIRVTVQIYLNQNQISSTSWIRAKY